MVKTIVPGWIKKRVTASGASEEVRQIISNLAINTVCESAVCPNIYECFSKRYLTFLIMGSRCTRDCKFCGVSGIPPAGEPDKDEPARVASAVKRLQMRYVVITSPTRDDLIDGGAAHYANTVREIRRHNPSTKIEVLIPDFRGDTGAVETVLESSPDIVSHNIETVRSLYSVIRPASCYAASLSVLRQIKDSGFESKSSFMLGLGEDKAGVQEMMKDLRQAGCDYLVIGQYLRPSQSAYPVQAFIRPEVFAEYRHEGAKMGFKNVFAGTFYRSSYMAESLCEKGG